LALNNPAPQEFVAVNSFGESGTPAQLMDKYKLNNEAIVAAVEKLLQENNSISIEKKSR
jgi:transketolase